VWVARETFFEDELERDGSARRGRVDDETTTTRLDAT
jgi:hypothetical protein